MNIKYSSSLNYVRNYVRIRNDSVCDVYFDKIRREINDTYCIYLGRSKKKNTQNTTVRDTLLLEDDQNQMKTASTSNSTITGGNSSQTLNIEHLDWVRGWEQVAAVEYQNTLQLSRHAHDNEKCVSPLKRGSLRAKTETVSSLPKYAFKTNNMSVYLFLTSFFSA